MPPPAPIITSSILGTIHALNTKVMSQFAASGPTRAGEKVFVRIFFLLMLSLPLFSFGQQESVFTQYMFNRLAINPAYAGSKGVWDFNAMYRHQWVGFEGAPRTLNVSAHKGFGGNRHGAGLVVINDMLGDYRQTAIAGNYAFRIKLRFGPGKYGFLSMGLQAAVLNHGIDLDAIRANDIDDPYLRNANNSTWTPDFSTGLLLNTSRWYVGASYVHLAPFEVQFDDSENSTLDGHLMATGGIDIPTSRTNRNFVISPAMFVRYVPTNGAFQFDVNTNFTFLERFWVGVNYRYQDAVSGLVGFFPHKRLRIGYSYDFVTSDLSPYQTGTHEVTVGFSLGKKQSRVLTPRYF